MSRPNFFTPAVCKTLRLPAQVLWYYNKNNCNDDLGMDI